MHSSPNTLTWALTRTFRSSPQAETPFDNFVSRNHIDMVSEGPAVRFSQDSAIISFWANRTGLHLFDTQQREAVYSKATEFLLERGSKLIANYGWKEDTSDLTSILKLSRADRPHLVLPASFASFLEASEADKWGEMFDLFDAEWDRTNDNLFIDSPTPLSDIFYLLQTLLPGMLFIYRRDDDDIGIQEWTRALPPVAWVEEHKVLLQTVFGDHTERYDHLLATAADRGLAEEMSCDYDDEDYSAIRFGRGSEAAWDDDYQSFYNSDSDGCYMNRFGQWEVKDLTACDKECGYCGTCDY